MCCSCAGMNGDTLDGVNGSFWEESLLRDYPIVIEPEIMYTNYQYLSTNVMSWGYWTNTFPIPVPGPDVLNPMVPRVSTYKAITQGTRAETVHYVWIHVLVVFLPNQLFSIYKT